MRRGRAAWAGDLETQTVSRVAPPRVGWTVEALLRRSGRGALVAFDAPLGLPRTYLEHAGYSSFAEWLERAPFGELFEPVAGLEEWSVRRPFVRPARGGWTAVVAAAPFELFRSIDRATNAESVFKLIGAKQVGRAAQELWRELRAARRNGIEYALWPFEGELAPGPAPVVAEIYPRTAYAAAVGPLPFVKRDARARVDALTRVSPPVVVEDLAAAAASDDDFDACVSAVALLQRLLEGRPLVDPTRVDAVFEGAILAT